MVGSFWITRLSEYYIKKVAVTDRQTREHLAQAQRKKRRINKTRMTTGVDSEPFFCFGDG
jgi:hypothetical protein